MADEPLIPTGWLEDCVIESRHGREPDDWLFCLVGHTAVARLRRYAIIPLELLEDPATMNRVRINAAKTIRRVSLDGTAG